MGQINNTIMKKIFFGAFTNDSNIAEHMNTE